MGDETPSTSSSPRPPPDSLCSACKTITGEALLQTRPFKHGTEYKHYNATGELEEENSTPAIAGIYHTLFLDNPAASVETCAACRLFHSAVYGGVTLSEPVELRLCLRGERDMVEVEDVGKVEVEREKAEKTGQIMELDGRGTVSVFVDYGTSIAAQAFPRRAIARAGSDEMIACVRRWIGECDLEHATCRLGLVGDVIEDEPQMPTRVIDVGSFDGCDPPCLLETNAMRGRYIAVSHSWGTVVRPYTTSKNVESLKKSIDFESLPKTFRDAIFIARKLEVRYVWIDSLCIIQDDHEDWEREAKTMGLVYEKAYLAISASESQGDHAGFLTPNDKVKMDVALPFRSGSEASGLVYLRGVYTTVIEPRQTAISRRGWVLQERTLSRRILHFNGVQTHWECSLHRVSEDGAKENTTSNVNTSYFLGQNIKPLAGGTSNSGNFDRVQRREALNTLYHFYACKVHEFSDCKLTYATDKLPAILGLGNEISRGTGIRFLEGHLLFEEPLFVYSLLWYTEIFSIEGSGIPDQVRAPSWSWAAMDGARVFHLLGQDLEFERRIFLRIESVLERGLREVQVCSSLLCFGRVVAGVKGDAIPDRNFGNFYGGYHKRMWEEDNQFQAPTFSYRILDPVEAAGRSWPRESGFKGWVCFDSMQVRPDKFFFVPVCAPPAGKERDHPETTRGCLGLIVVEACVSEQYDVPGIMMAYKRVGFGGLYGTGWFESTDEVRFILV